MSTNPHARAASAALQVLQASAGEIQALGLALAKLHSSDTTAPIDVDKMRETLSGLESELGSYRGALYALRNALAKHQAEKDHQASKARPAAKGGKKKEG